MWTTRTRSLVIGGGAAVLVAAAGTAGGFAAAHATDSGPSTPVAATSSSTPGVTTDPTTQPGKAGKAGKHARGDVITALKGLQHAQWVVAGKDGAYVTHDAIRGTVTAVSSTSVTVKAQDGVSQTYAVGDSTRVTLRGKAAGSTPSASPTTTSSDAAPAGAARGGARGSISDVTTGAEVLVSGTGTDSLTADRVVVSQG